MSSSNGLKMSNGGEPAEENRGAARVTGSAGVSYSGAAKVQAGSPSHNVPDVTAILGWRLDVHDRAGTSAFTLSDLDPYVTRNWPNDGPPPEAVAEAMARRCDWLAEEMQRLDAENRRLRSAREAK